MDWKNISYAAMVLALGGMLGLNLWVAIHRKASLWTMLSAIFTRSGGYSPIQRHIENVFEAILAIGFLILAATLTGILR